MSMVRAHTFQHFGLPANDLAAAKDFYMDILGLHAEDPEPPGPDTRNVRLYAGADPSAVGQTVVLFLRAKKVDRDTLARREESLKLVQAGDTIAAAELVEDGRTHHAWVVSQEDFEAAPARLKERGIPYSAPVPRGGGTHSAIYFFDPDGNQLQLTDHL